MKGRRCAGKTLMTLLLVTKSVIIHAYSIVPNPSLSGAAWVAPTSSTSRNMGLPLEQYSSGAITLFNNMKTPASILAGALVPLGFMGPIPFVASSSEMENETPLLSRLRKAYYTVASISFLSLLISIMWSTVAVNQLTETTVSPAASVWHLLQRDYDIHWAGTNSHFVLGMFGFAFCVACRSYFFVAPHNHAMARSLSGIAISSLLLMVSIVNRTISIGAGDGTTRYGKSIGALFSHYGYLLVKQACSRQSFGPLEFLSLILGTTSIVSCIRHIFAPVTGVQPARSGAIVSSPK
jgi:hypothetical protein